MPRRQSSRCRKAASDQQRSQGAAEDDLIRDRLKVGRLALNQEIEVRILVPELRWVVRKVGYFAHNELMLPLAKRGYPDSVFSHLFADVAQRQR